MRGPSEQMQAARQCMELRELPPELRLRASALLARQALEASIADYLIDRGMKPSAMPFGTQLACVRYSVDDVAVAELAASTWALLSRACHYHGYELPPTPTDLQQWLGSGAAVVARLKEAG